MRRMWIYFAALIIEGLIVHVQIWYGIRNALLAFLFPFCPGPIGLRVAGLETLI